MEKTYNKLSPQQQKFFTRLGNYLDTPLYYFGSIQRFDYIPGYSDIDVLIFSDNLTEIKYKLANFLKLNQRKIKRIVKHLDNKVFHGLQMKYTDEVNNVVAEINVFLEKDKEDYLHIQRTQKDNVPFYIAFVLYIVKLFFYRLQWISSDQFKKIKRSLLSPYDTNEFVSVD